MRAAPTPTVFEDVIPSIGARLGLTVHVDPERPGSGQIVAPDGHRLHFRDTQVDLNGACAAAVAADRERMAYHLLRMGYPVPDGRVFHFDARSRPRRSDTGLDAGYRYAREELGWPVVVKAQQAGSGVGAAVVGTRREYERAMREVARATRGHAALVQRRVEGEVHGVLVLDGAVLAAYQRSPLPVRGDGRRTIGGSAEAVDLTGRIHPEFRALASRLARDAGLRYCGIDLISPHSLADPVREYTVIALDAAPDLDPFCSVRDEPRREVEAIAERMLRAAMLRRPGSGG